jgi:hypothetical protein
VRRGIDNKFAKEQLYWEAQKIDRWPGGAYPGAEPHMEGSSVLAAVKVAKRLGYIEEYRWAFGIEDVKKAISEIGPVILGVPWYEGIAGCSIRSERRSAATRFSPAGSTCRARRSSCTTVGAAGGETTAARGSAGKTSRIC